MLKVEKLKLNTLKIIDNKKRCLITIKFVTKTHTSKLGKNSKNNEKKEEKKRIKK